MRDNHYRVDEWAKLVNARISKHGWSKLGYKGRQSTTKAQVRCAAREVADPHAPIRTEVQKRAGGAPMCEGMMQSSLVVPPMWDAHVMSHGSA
eukprot:1872874-Prymnesium_polylepis.1